MATAKSQTTGFETAVQKPMGNAIIPSSTIQPMVSTMNGKVGLKLNCKLMLKKKKKKMHDV